MSPWHEDLHRLLGNEWVGHPQLAAAFLEGYGRDLSADDAQALMATSLLGHLDTIVWAYEHAEAAFEEHARRSLAWDRTALETARPDLPPPPALNQ